MNSSLLSGKRALVMGVANDMSLATFAAKALKAHGAQLLLTCHSDEKFHKRALKVAHGLGLDSSQVVPFAVEKDAEVDAAFSKIEDWAGMFGLNFCLHSIGYSNPDLLEGPFFDTLNRENFRMTMEVSCYSFLDFMRRLKHMMPAGSSIATLTYDAPTHPLENYNMMVLGKAGLEAGVRLGALWLGEKKIRVNAISSSPEKTLSGMAIGNAYRIGRFSEAMSPMGRRATPEEVANAVVFLASDLSSGMTGQTLYVNCGTNIPGLVPSWNRETMLKALYGEGAEPKPEWK